jgi:hypothetical protein
MPDDFFSVKGAGFQLEQLYYLILNALWRC